jgi:hypothetical protein
MSLPSVYNTKNGGKELRSSRSKKSISKQEQNHDPSPFSNRSTNATSSLADVTGESGSNSSNSSNNNNSSNANSNSGSKMDNVDNYPKRVPASRLDQLLNTLGKALETDSTLNRGKWVVPTTNPKNNNYFEMNEVVPPFPLMQTYSSGVYGNVVARELTENETRPPAPSATDYLCQAAVDLPQEGGPSLESDIERDFKQRLNRLNSRHNIYTSRMEDRVAYLKSIGTNFDEATQSCISRSTLAHLLYERKCRVQSSVASRRLQELLFECLGEIEKACLRSTLLAKTLCENVIVQKTQIEKSTLWKEFLMRAEEDAKQQLNLAALDHKEYQDYFHAVSEECKEALTSSRYVPEEAIIHVERIVAVRPGRGMPQTRRRGKDTRRRVSRLHHKDDEVAVLLAALNKEYAKINIDGSNIVGKRKSSGGGGSNDTKVEVEEKQEDEQKKRKVIRLRHGYVSSVSGLQLPLFPSVVQISSSLIKWLLPPSGCSVNSTIYYCLEERMEKWSSRSGHHQRGSTGTKSKDGTITGATYSKVQHTICNLLSDVYDGQTGKRREETVSRMSVFEVCTEHRHRKDVIESRSLEYDEKVLVEKFFAGYPDVLRVSVGAGESGRILHFAPATVLHIFETKMCQSICQLLDKDSKQKIHEHYPDDSVMRTADLKLYYLDQGEFKRQKKKQHSQMSPSSIESTKMTSPLIGSQMLKLESEPMRELCAIYGVSGQTDGTTVPLPDSMSILMSEKSNFHHANQKDPLGQQRQKNLSYFILHNPTTKAVQLFLDKRMARSKKARLARKQDCYGGLVEKERVAAVEYSRNKPLPGSRRNSNKKDDEDATGSTVPCLALLVGVYLPHRHRSSLNDGANDHGSGDDEDKHPHAEEKKIERVDNDEVDVVRKRSSSISESTIISGLAVGSFCRWRGCLCKGTKIPVLSSGKQSKHALCGLHSILRSFLEGCGAKEELARHLPSNKNMKSVLAKHKTTTEITIEFLRITATSALLQELLGGKLAATIRAFCRRAAADARALKPPDTSVGKSSMTRTGNAMTSEQNRIAMKENEIQKKDLNQDVTLSQQVYKTESEVANELRQLCAMGVFPKAELQTIRETYNELDRERIRLLAQKNKEDQSKRQGEEEYEPSSIELSKKRNNGGVRTEGELELEFCKRKLAILRGRRQELELNISKGIDIKGYASTSQGRIVTNDGHPTISSQVPNKIEPPTTTLQTHENMSPHERAIIHAAAREVEIVAAAQEAQQQSIARARLSDARKFSKNHYSNKKSTVEELQAQKSKVTSRNKLTHKSGKSSRSSKMSTGAAYLGKC